MTRLRINRLSSGGLITNYYCTSSCKHCLYRCSPKWPKHYMDESTARMALECCISMGCKSIHIGGGEPFLNITGLKKVLKAAKDMGVHIQYVETNASWCTESARTEKVLTELQNLGLSTLLISISPFHIEYIPLERVLTLISACEKCQISVFPWTEDYLQEFSRLDPSRRYSLDELENIFGPGYVESIPSRYWIHPGGRALETFFKNGRPLEKWLQEGGGGCLELADTSHFHIDLYLNYVPGLCAGLSIYAPDLKAPIAPGDYPIVSTLFKKGITGLYELALSKGFTPSRQDYGSKCTLCYELRCFLAKKEGRPKDLAPVYHYM